MSFTKLLEKEKIAKLIAESLSLVEVSRKLGYSDHGRYTKQLREFCISNSISIEHFSGNGKAKTEVHEAICPQCTSLFTFTAANYKDTCSHACANKYFAYKQGAKNRKDGITAYRSKIERHYNENNRIPMCVHCTESKVLDVHHIDEDRENNSIDNLVYLCPTHHAYLHRLNDSDVIDSILRYIVPLPITKEANDSIRSRATNYAMLVGV